MKPTYSTAVDDDDKVWRVSYENLMHVWEASIMCCSFDPPFYHSLNTLLLLQNCPCTLLQFYQIPMWVVCIMWEAASCFLL